MKTAEISAEKVANNSVHAKISLNGQNYYRKQRRIYMQILLLIFGWFFLSALFSSVKDKITGDDVKEENAKKNYDGVAVEVLTLQKGHTVRNGFIHGSCDSAGGWDAMVELRNISAKTINYIFVYLTPYDRIGNPSGKTKSIKYVGPLKTFAKTGNCFYEHLWYDISLDKIKVDKIVVEFEDKSRQTIVDGKVV